MARHQTLRTNLRLPDGSEPEVSLELEDDGSWPMRWLIPDEVTLPDGRVVAVSESEQDRLAYLAADNWSHQ